MTNSTIDESQRKAAEVVGFTYLLAIVAAIFEFSVRARLIGPPNGAETAQKILAHQLLFRLSIASKLIVFATDVVLITALYVVLKPVNRNLALLAAFWRLIETQERVRLLREWASGHSANEVRLSDDAINRENIYSGSN